MEVTVRAPLEIKETKHKYTKTYLGAEEEDLHRKKYTHATCIRRPVCIQNLTTHKYCKAIYIL